MDKEKSSQLELFAQGSDESAVRSELPSALRGYLCHFEKSILMIIVFLITAIVAFCVGVEKGRKIGGFRGNLQFDTAANRQELKRQPVLKTLLPSPKTENTVNVNSVISNNIPDKVKPSLPKQNGTVGVPNKDTDGGFTIQVATYITRTSAQSEIERLKRKGFAPLIVSNGGYNVICVGNFTKKEMAKSLLSKLRQNYRDCYIRRL